MFLIATIAWTAICGCWAFNGLGWPLWQSHTTVAWYSLGPMGRIDDSSVALIVTIVLWVTGLAIMVGLKGKSG